MTFRHDKAKRWRPWQFTLKTFLICSILAPPVVILGQQFLCVRCRALTFSKIDRAYHRLLHHRLLPNEDPHRPFNHLSSGTSMAPE